MRMPGPNDPELSLLVERYLKPPWRYLNLLHGNWLTRTPAEQREFLTDLRRDADLVSNRELDVLMDSEWRANLTAAWLIAVSRRISFRDRLGQELVRSQLVYAGQGFAVALVNLGGEESAAWLVRYLRRWLPETSCRYDQDWVMAALICLDEARTTRHAEEFLGPSSSWEAWAAGQVELEPRARLVGRLVAAIADDGCSAVAR